MTEETIFEAVLDKSTPAERSAYLDEVCAGDAALRQRVEGLLLAHDRAAPFWTARRSSNWLPKALAVTARPRPFPARRKAQPSAAVGPTTKAKRRPSRPTASSPSTS